jgi:hypothetical protein
VEEPDKDLGSVQQAARTCPVCGTKFFATAASRFSVPFASCAELLAGNMQQPGSRVQRLVGLEAINLSRPESLNPEGANQFSACLKC